MRDETFDYIWEQIVVKQIEILDQSYDDDTRNEYSLKCCSLNELKKNVLADYDDIRQELKRHYYDMSKQKKNPKNRIDRHKIAACMAYSLIRNKAFRFDVRSEMPKELFVINYQLAYAVSLGVVYTLLLAQYKLNGLENFADKLEQQKTLKVPDTSDGHNEYNTGRVYTLALNNLYGNTFDILTYSDMMFWIEHYNRQLIEDTVHPVNF